MKKSNLIILSAIGAVFIFSIAFQLRVNSHLRNSEIQKEVVANILEERTTNHFHKISVNNGIQVYFKQDSINQINIEAPENMMSYISTNVVNDTLVIEHSAHNKTRGLVKVHISTKQLSALTINSGAYFETLGEVSGKNLRLNFSSDSKANLELSYEQVKCKAASGSQIKFKGNTSNIEFSN